MNDIIFGFIVLITDFFMAIGNIENLMTFFLLNSSLQSNNSTDTIRILLVMTHITGFIMMFNGVYLIYKGFIAMQNITYTNAESYQDSQYNRNVTKDFNELQDKIEEKVSVEKKEKELETGSSLLKNENEEDVNIDNKNIEIQEHQQNKRKLSI